MSDEFVLLKQLPKKMKSESDKPNSVNQSAHASGKVWARRLALYLWSRVSELLVMAIVSMILIVAFSEFILKDQRPWWAQILAWLAVFVTYDLVKIARDRP